MKPKAKLALISFFLAILFTANFASAAIVNCGGSNQPPCAIADLIQTIINIINLLFSWAGLVAILLIVWSGLRMIFAAGNEETISSAKSSLSYAIVGFLIILFSFILVNFVIGLLTTGNNGATLNSQAFMNAFNLKP